VQHTKLFLVEEYEKEENAYQVNPIHYGHEKHLAAFIVSIKKRENKRNRRISLK
jgi:predicted fused transcriptional regulator/phosphomethylpyrimidine kinase